jgi:hypothetical protein
VYLELLTWYIQGYGALLAFKKARFKQRRSPDGTEDEGFYFTTDADPNPTWRLRDAVKNKIVELRERCHGGLREILDEIPNLLKINPLERPTAKQLAQKLKAPGPELRLDTFRRDSMLPDSPPLTPKLQINNHSNETDEHEFAMRLQQATE